MLVTKAKAVAQFALTLALTILLGSIKLSAFWPFGGSVTLFSMVPIVLMGLWQGPKAGFLVGSCYGIYKLLLGASNFAYVSASSAAISFLLDYFLGYGAIGLVLLFAYRGFKNESVRVGIGIFGAFCLRFIAHFISGIVVWSSLIGFGSARLGIIYCSIWYNILYLAPEMLITIVGVNVVTSYISRDSRRSVLL